MKTVCGTWAYCAPEVIRRKNYTYLVDNWTLGILMYIMLSGYHPFDMYGVAPEPELLSRIENIEYDYKDEVKNYHLLRIFHNTADLFFFFFCLNISKYFTN